MLGAIGMLVAWRAFDVVFDPIFWTVVNLIYPERVQLKQAFNGYFSSRGDARFHSGCGNAKSCLLGHDDRRQTLSVHCVVFRG